MIATMAKVQVAVPRPEKEQLLRWLQEEEVLHVMPITKMAARKDGGKYDLKLAELQYVLEFIGRVKKEKNILEKKEWKNIFAGKPAAGLNDLEETLAKLNIDQLVKEAHQASDELIENESLRHEFKDLANTLEPWRTLEITGQDVAETETTAIYFTKVSAREESLFKEKIAFVPTAAMREVSRMVTKKTGNVFFELLVHLNHRAAAEKVIGDTNAVNIKIDLPGKRSMDEYWQDTNDRIKALEDRYEEILTHALKHLRNERDLMFAYDAILHQKERLDADNQTVDFAWTAILGGWIPDKSLGKIQESFYQEFPAGEIEKVTPGKDEVPPVTFNNYRLIEPFEAVTNIFGKPRYHELDPSASLALFFLLAFGLALTDGGYGLLMAGGMWLADKYLRLKKEMRKMVRLLMYAGFSTFVFGALTGSWFGIVLEDLPSSSFRDLALSIKIIDPIKEPMTLLMAAFALGIIQLLFAWVVKGYDDWRKGNYTAVVFDDAAWITMVIWLLLWAGSSQGYLWPELAAIFKWLLLANTAVLILSQGRRHRNPLLKIGAGIMSLYGLVGFVSDTLSYSRLLALGLATGIIALVVNLMGNMVYEAVPGVGFLFAAIVLLIGHAFNLGINTLGAFIHSGRLQFVEFFPKFMEGGGEPYRPLGRVSKYVDNPKDFK